MVIQRSRFILAKGEEVNTQMKHIYETPEGDGEGGDEGEGGGGEE